jgi:predicted regulator of Ras-like GTPase activity (Roadblock/LC7/MglB family)
MRILTLFNNIREIKNAVVADLSGALLESMGDPDSEAVAAVAGYTAATMNEVGETLGLGGLEQLSFSGPSSACIVTMLDTNVVATFIDPAVSLAGVEKKLDITLHRAQR